MHLKESLLQENLRGDSYKLLSDCYYPPDEKLIEKIKKSDISKGGVCIEIAKYIPLVDELEELKVDYARLFVGPFKLLAPPYGSLYLEGTRTLMGDSTIDAKKRYSEESLNISLKEAPDYIAIELEFMYVLAFKYAQAIAEADSKKAATYLQKQASFLEIHLSKWVSEFTDKVEANSQTNFYKNLAKVTRLFVQDDLTAILDKIGQ